MKKIRIKNFGPISDATINIKAFTIFGGVNNTGKSFASRLIYSIFKSLQNDLYSQRANALINTLQNRPFMWYIEDFISRKKLTNKKVIHALNSISDISSRLTSELNDLDYNKSDFTIIKRMVPETIESIRLTMAELNESRSSSELSEIVEQLDIYLEELRYFGKQVNLSNISENFIRHQLRENVERELKGNFQVGSISTLFGRGKTTPSVRFTDGSTDIEFTLIRKRDGFEIEIGSINSIRLYPSNLFLESPIYLKLATSLNPRYSLLHSTKRERRLIRRPIAGVPDYVSFLRSELSNEFTGDIAFPRILEWIQGHVGGKIELSRTGQLRFNDGEGSYPLQTTATGIANIGMIGLLIERKLINEGTVLFIDEPECNLHTAWQVVMAKLLMKLSRIGVQIVVATHSTEILKYIENCSKADPDIAEHVALNYFPFCEDVNQDFASQLDKMLEDLTKPYFELFLDGI